MKEIANRIALITGASQGIGKAIAMALAAKGATVILLARNQEKLQSVKTEIETAGGQASYYVCDASDYAALRDVLKRIDHDTGGVDILVNNAGVGTFQPLEQMKPEEAEAPVHLPFGAAVVASHHVIPGMLKKGAGHIVNITGPAGYFPLPYMVPYTAARHAINGLSHALHEEFSAHGIGVTLLCPGQVNTGYFSANDADMNWYPRLAKIFPVLQPEAVAKRTVQAIEKNRREVIFPWILWIFVRWYMKLPRLTFALLRLLRLLRPVNSPPR